MNNEPVAWKAYEEVHFSDKYILRWIREDDEYVNKITKEMMEDLKSVVRQQQAEIEALNELNTMLKDAIEKRIGLDAERYKWLRAEFAAGRETYLAEGMPSGESLDKYIDWKLK